jgi:hypothetical protein
MTILKGLTLVFALLFSLASNADTLIGQVFFTKGKVEVVRGDVRLSLLKGDKLFAGDMIITDIMGLLIVNYLNQSKLKIDGGSQVYLEEQASDGREKSGKSLILNLMNGSLMMDFNNPNKDNEVSVQAKHVSLGVRGTKFFMGIDREDNENIYAAVNSGKVEVFNFEQDDFEAIKAGQGLVFEKGKKITKPHSFEWNKNLNWKTGARSRGSGFLRGPLVRKRRGEFRRLFSKLRQRKKRPILRNIRQRWMKRRKKQKGHRALKKLLRARKSGDLRNKKAGKGLLRKNIQKKRLNNQQRRRLIKHLRKRKKIEKND